MNPLAVMPGVISGLNKPSLAQKINLRQAKHWGCVAGLCYLNPPPPLYRVALGGDCWATFLRLFVLVQAKRVHLLK